MLMLSGTNLLLLDEPTNHLDVESIEALEDAVERFDGTVILVSHDRELLRSLTTRLWVLHDRRVTEFDGGFDEWEVVSAERAKAAAVRAAEAVATQRVKERQRVAAAVRPAPAGRDDRATLREAARRELSRAEARVVELERDVSALTARLQNPELYTGAGGISEAGRLGAQLAAAQRELERALREWTAAGERVESLAEERR
jgi:ATP-binding cassette subfamily F protein 3